VVLLKNSVSQMVYKHAISTVVPTRNVRLPSGEVTAATRPRTICRWRTDPTLKPSPGRVHLLV
jgi:hypothetical protein